MRAGRLGILSVGLIFGLSACTDLLGGGPVITSFTATPSSITAGQSSTLAWSVDSSATSITISGGVGNVTSDTDDRATVTPAVTTEYTLTATNSSGSRTRTATVTVVGGGTDTGGTPPLPPGDGDPTSVPTGSFGVSTSATGEFSNDADGGISGDTDERIISVAAGGTFYAQVEYEDPQGIASVTINIVNDDPPDTLEGPLPIGGFSLTGQNTGECTTGATATTISCVYAITVAPGTPDISALPGANDEFAYVFRVRVADTAGNAILGQNRGYVNITP